MSLTGLSQVKVLEALRGESLSLPFSAPRGHLRSLAHDSFLTFQPHAWDILSPTTNSHLLSPYNRKDPCDYIRFK